MNQKAFSVAEANALLPKLEAVLSDIDRRMDRVQRASERLQILDLIWGTSVHEPGNPDHADALRYRSQVAALLTEVEEIVDREIVERGVRLASGALEYGLIDFPTTWRGRWVYLCWRRGEPTVRSWHEVDEGFAGRHAITLEQIHMMGQGIEAPRDPDQPWS
jgi:hypothetical protein